MSPTQETKHYNVQYEKFEMYAAINIRTYLIFILYGNNSLP